jgi:anti-anti-sigma factor
VRLNGNPTCASNAKAFDGPFGYVFKTSNVITHLPFPKRLNGDPSEKLGHMLDALDEKQVYAVIIDCTHLAHINSVGLTSIAAQVKRLRLHLFHVQPSVKRVIDVVGLSPLIDIHTDITAALKGAVERVQRKS